MPNSEQNRTADTANSDGAALSAEPRGAQNGQAPAEEQIRLRAYELYRARGATPGSDLGDWLEAEREYREQS